MSKLVSNQDRSQAPTNPHSDTVQTYYTHTVGGPGSVTWIGAIICGRHISLGSVTLQNLWFWEFHTQLWLSAEAEAVFPHCYTGKCFVAAFMSG